MEAGGEARWNFGVYVYREDGDAVAMPVDQPAAGPASCGTAEGV